MHFLYLDFPIPISYAFFLFGFYNTNFVCIFSIWIFQYQVRMHFFYLDFPIPISYAFFLFGFSNTNFVCIFSIWIFQYQFRMHFFYLDFPIPISYAFFIWIFQYQFRMHTKLVLENPNRKNAYEIGIVKSKQKKCIRNWYWKIQIKKYIRNWYWKIQIKKMHTKLVLENPNRKNVYEIGIGKSK